MDSEGEDCQVGSFGAKGSEPANGLDTSITDWSVPAHHDGWVKDHGNRLK